MYRHIPYLLIDYLRSIQREYSIRQESEHSRDPRPHFPNELIHVNDRGNFPIQSHPKNTGSPVVDISP